MRPTIKDEPMAGYPPDNTAHQQAPMQKNSLGKRLGWLFLIWSLSVLVLGISSLAIKFLMNISGFQG